MARFFEYSWSYWGINFIWLSENEESSNSLSYEKKTDHRIEHIRRSSYQLLFKLIRSVRPIEVQCILLELTRICTRVITIKQLFSINIRLKNEMRTLFCLSKLIFRRKTKRGLMPIKWVLLLGWQSYISFHRGIIKVRIRIRNINCCWWCRWERR